MGARLALLSFVLGALLPSLANADIYNRTKLGKQDMSMREMISAKLKQLPAMQTGCPTGTRFDALRVTGFKSLHAAPCRSVASIEFKARAVKDVKILGKTLTVPTLYGCKGVCTIETGFTGIPQITNFQVTGLLKQLKQLLPSLGR
jgi:hypothetical protein